MNTHARSFSLNKAPPNAEFELGNQHTSDSIRYIEHGAPSSHIRWHYHKDYELHLIKATSGMMFVGDHVGEFKPGNLVLIGPDLPHNWVSHLNKDQRVDVRDQAIQFSHEFVCKCQEAIPELNSVNALLEKSVYGIEFYNRKTVAEVQDLFDELAESQNFSRVISFFKIMERLQETEHYQLLSTRTDSSPDTERNLVWMEKVVDYISKHYASVITLKEVADHMSMGETHFSKYFKKTSGLCFIDYINRLRVCKACELLSYTDTPVTEICFSVGFNNISNFNRRFIKVKGISPREYRKSFRANLSH